MAIYRGDMMDDLNDMLMGGMDDDTLIGGMGNDELDGMGGDDRLIGGPGADVLIGGTNGMLGDTADYIRSYAGVYVDIGSIFNIDDDDKPPIHSGHAEGDTITEVENIFGSKFGDILRGNHQANRLFGYRGDDILAGREGNDYLRGESGADAVMGESGSDMLFGDMGNDKVSGGSGHDMLWGGKGDDVLHGGTGNDVLEGGAGEDLIDGGGYKMMDGEPTEERLENDGSDTAAYTRSDMPVTINLMYADPDPRPEAMGGHAEGDIFMSIENVTGSMHDDMLAGDNGKNTIKGGMGNDSIKGTGDTVESRAAMDMADKLYGEEGMDTLYGGAGNDSLDGGMGNDALKGEDGSDKLTGGPGADKLFGGRFDPDTMMAGDDDQMTGSMMADGTMIGDAAAYEKSPEGVMVSLIAKDHDDNRNTPDTVVGEGGDAEGDVLEGIENLIGSDHKDLLEGDSGANYLQGGKGNDFNDPSITGRDGGLYGNEGNDILDGGAGNDLLQGGEGDDTLKGGSGHDTLVGGDGGTYTAAVEADATADPPVVGSPEKFTEVLEGGSGNDILRGGDGVDLLKGGAGNDTADFSDQDGAITINLDNAGSFNEVGDTDDTGTAGVSEAFDAANDRLLSIENLTGGSGADIFIGNRHANVLNGGEGGDTLTGGEGADTFVFEKESVSGATDNALDSPVDTITDFSKRQGDRIDLSDLELSSSELRDVIDAANAGGSANANQVTLSLELSDHGARDITITMSERFTELDVDDFII